jgi:hypothetical protein
MIEQYEFAKRLRSLARRSDTFGKDRQTILEEIIMMAEHYETWAERIEMAQIMEAQQPSWEKDVILAEVNGIEIGVY